MRILIPAYEPDERLISLIHDIREYSGFETVVVDDGSGIDYIHLFIEAERLGCTVLRHPVNLGKGAALKTGFQYLLQIHETEGVVCADCDGQHAVKDICAVAEETLQNDDTAVLGVRRFDGKVPVRNKMGNTITRWIFSLSAGYRIQDTQTGLRGYPAAMLPWLCRVEGTRFEYELNILLGLKSAGYSVKEITIQTIYKNGNKSSHFNPFLDSIRVYVPFIKFSASSLSAAFLDFVLLLCFRALFQQLLPAVVLSRTVSSVFNFLCNKYFVFRSPRQKNLQSAPRYFMLVAVIMLLNYGLLNFFVQSGLFIVPAKILTETILFFVSYTVQKKLVFRKNS